MHTADRTTVVLVRHGETDWNREGRTMGIAPVPLNDRGREQARRLGERLVSTYDISRVVASDLRRARETAALLVGAGVDATPEFDPGWRERDVGIYQGMEKATLDEQFPAFAFENGIMALEERPPDGECLLDAYERVVDSWERLCASADGETVLVVTHGGPITGVLAHVNGDDLLSAIEGYTVDNCSLTEIQVGEETAVRREAVLDP